MTKDKDEQIMVSTRASERQRPVNDDDDLNEGVAATASAKSAVFSKDHGIGQDSVVGSPNVSVAKGVAAEASVAQSAVSSGDGKGQDSEVGSPNALAAEVNSDDVEGKLKFTITTQQHTQNNV